jgi:hypothetical protein
MRRIDNAITLKPIGTASSGGLVALREKTNELVNNFTHRLLIVRTLSFAIDPLG